MYGIAYETTAISLSAGDVLRLHVPCVPETAKDDSPVGVNREPGDGGMIQGYPQPGLWGELHGPR